LHPFRWARLCALVCLGSSAAFLGLSDASAGEPPLAADGSSATPACAPRFFEDSAFTVCRYDPRESVLELDWRAANGPLGSLAALKTALGRDTQRVIFAMNAGMYDARQAPIGLYITHGVTEHDLNQASGTGNFYLLPNGVFWTDPAGRPHIDETSRFATLRIAPQLALQSGPLLVEHGRLHPQIAANGSWTYVRNAVGVRDGRALFVISSNPVSLGRLARFMRDGLGCPDVLYLDGFVSSLWAPSLNRQDTRSGLGPFIIALHR
jgi:uncharacterized protein YigE (DUF2233 family)